MSRRTRLISKYRLLVVSFLLGLIVGTNTLAWAQNSERPKIGLVLSGGGAKGLAHIGVLKSLEEAGIYPDYITGTSMGSIVGGLYAMGYSADQIDSIARGIDWSTLLSNEIALNKVAFEEKFYYGRYLIEFPFRNKKIGLPIGLIEGQELTLQLSNMTRPAHEIEDFNDLPIPFACMGANIVTGYPRVISSGLLPEALRASMAIPTFFTPMEIDSSLYVDGGLLKNFPVQEVIDMGADIVIGVSVSSGLESRENLNSMTSILSQAAFITSALDTEEQMKLVNILVLPNLEGFSTASFNASNEILEVGYETGKAYYNQFKQLADSLSIYGPMKPPKRPKIPTEYRFEHIEIVGNKIVPSELIQGKLRVEPNVPFTIKKLEERISLLYGTLYFTKIVYSINPLTSTLTIKVTESPRGSLRTAVHYDSDNKVGITLNLTLRNILFPSTRFIFEFDFAENPNAYLSYFKYLGKKQNLAAVLKGSWIKTDLPSYWDESSIENSPNNTGVNGVLANSIFNSSINFQTTSKTNSTAGISLQYLNHNIKPVVLDSISLGSTNVAFNQMTTKDYGATLFYRQNTLNKPFLTTKGIYLNLTFEYFFSRKFKINFDGNSTGPIESETTLSNHFIAIADFRYAHPLTTRLTLLTRASLRIGSGNGGLEWYPYETQIGGARPLGWSVYSYSATPSNRFSNLNFASLGLGLQFETFNNLFFTAFTDYLESEYPMKWIDTAIYTSDIGAYPRRLGFNFKLSYNTIVGPLEIGVGKDQYLSGAHFFFGFGCYIKN
jgi:NTE family protein